MLRLYTFYRSTAAYRVRIALNYKKIPHELIPVNLNKSEQHNEEFKRQNPHRRVPTLIDGDVKIGQSAAILEYLEEKFPNPPLLPSDIKARAWVRYLSQIIISDMHPVMNRSSVVAYLKTNSGFTESQVEQWTFNWLKQGFDALETNLNLHSNNSIFCFGESPTIADVCLIPQVYNAYKFNFQMNPYPTLQRIYENCTNLDYFKKASPENQMDYSEAELTTDLLLPRIKK